MAIYCLLCESSRFVQFVCLISNNKKLISCLFVLTIFDSGMDLTVKTASTSTENLLMTGKLQRAPSLPRTYNRNRSGIPVANREPPVRGCSRCYTLFVWIENFLFIVSRFCFVFCASFTLMWNVFFSSTKAGFRSISAVDTAAVQRARARAQYSNMARMKVTPGTASLRKSHFENLFLLYESGCSCLQ